MKLSNPWPAGETIRSVADGVMRKHPITGRRKKHRGVDVGYNGPIYAPADGKVVHKGASLNKRTGGGYTLILEHQRTACVDCLLPPTGTLTPAEGHSGETWRGDRPHRHNWGKHRDPFTF